MSARGLLERYASGDDPCEEVERALAAVEEWEPRLNAFAHVARDSALAQAEESRRRWRDDTARPLEGVPVAIKDLIDVAGQPTGWGTKVEPPRPARADAPLVARLRAAGAVLIGKTNCLEYAYGVAHLEIGQTNNPHDPSRTAGGSSGGSAAAVGAGIVPLAVGTDTGGSIRIPAAHCGIVGLKPSYGLVPLEGVFPLSWTLDHAGPLAGDVADAALMLGVLAGQAMAASAPRAPRIGVLRAHWPAAAENRATAAAMDAALYRLGAAELVEVTIPELGGANAALLDLLLPEASVIHRDLHARNPGGYAPGTRSQIEAGFDLPATRYVDAMREAARVRAAVEAAFPRVDLLLSPAVPFPAPHEDPEIGDAGDSEMLASGFANLTGHPALTLPCGAVDGLPVGLQLAGPLGRDAALLAAAQVVERMLGRASDTVGTTD
ncbi:amidase [Wenxinia saemankumensis]|uniref:Aspartyl-tRNA(Asn)/glutamyl-tRNA(Gln) amidotransferase subunit A n=1 Tax=Wenxinia saemankumensis TaxID=1447782 RepID=A0A1M6B367_9RHOB|nr:amidase [Wenxinia saemankumensis]SHI43192.1 aspartyl-tRNA(Asn)/glutamyl-tRNA(Gln) amidotransferase subunit A [Wenxinia saemankumensis]